MRRSPSAVSIALLTLVAPLAGCQSTLLESDLPDPPEENLAGSDLRAQWTPDGAGHLVSGKLDAVDGATRVGLLVELTAEGALPALEARGTDATGFAGAWVPLRETFFDGMNHVAIAELGLDAVSAQLRVTSLDAERVAVLTWTAVVPVPVDESAAAAQPEALTESEVGARAEELRADLASIGVRSRASWRARGTRCTGRDANKYRVAIHHTVTPSNGDFASRLRGIQAYHMDSNGWCDVGYHFLVTADGSIWEGRPLELLGAHAGGQNTGNAGISLVGCFHTSGCASFQPNVPPDAMIESAGRLAGKLARIHGFSITTATLRGHGQYPGQQTTCPGANVLSRLERIRSVARAGGSAPSPTPTPTPGGGSCRHTTGGGLYGNRACSASYQCCAGSWATRGACGACACTESTGTRGCSASGPPAGAACTHTSGGRFANTACSPGYQCCDGQWKSRGACGSCFCTESTGRVGCGT